MSGAPEGQAEGDVEGEAPRRVFYKRARPVQELILEAQEKAGYRVNAAVRIVGLQNAAHLNGCRGKILYHVPESGRWQVILEDGPDAGQNKALKADNLEPLDAPKRPLPAQRRPLQVGDRAEIRGLESRPELNGRTCLLLMAEPTRWRVQLDGTQEEKLMKPKHLHRIDDASGSAALGYPPPPPPPPPPPEKRPAARPQYFISGSWDNWTPCQMDWDEERHCYMFNVVLGSRGFENFLLLVDGDWKQCLHPDRANACPHVDYTLCGPDNSGQQVKSWTIGRHPNDQSSVGARYEVRLVLTDDLRAGQVDWLRLFSPQESAAAVIPSAASAQAAPAAAPKASPVAAPKAKAKSTHATLLDVLKAVFEEVKAKGGQLFEADPAWECVGGADKGGILVREGEELGSTQTKDRLATGAIVKQRALKGERLHYEILRGKGPTSGWVSIKFKEKDGRVKDLMVVTDKVPRPALKDKDLGNFQDRLGKAKVKTLTDLLIMLRDLGTDGLNTRLKAAGPRGLLPQVLARLKHFAEAAEQGAAMGGSPGGPAGLPDPQLPPQQFEVVHDIAMIRAEPTTNAKALGRRLKGEKVSGVEETFDGFVRLEGDQGWVVRDMKGKLGVGKLLAPLGKEPQLARPEIADEPGPKRFEVVYKTVAVRDNPSVSGKILGARSLGEFVDADMQSYHGWVRLSDDAGWMLSWKEELGQLLKPAPPAPKGPRIISAPIQQEEDDIDDIARWAQAEVARRKGRPPPPDPKEEAHRKKEAEEKERRKQEALRKAAEEEEKRLRDQEASKKVVAEARRQEAEAQQRRAAEEAEAEAERRRQEEAMRAEEEARIREEARLEGERRRQQQEARRREEEEAQRRREEEERGRQREEEERRRREQEELRQQQEAAELRRQEELARAKSTTEAVEGGASQDHAALLERFREAVVSGDQALIKSTRDAAKKGGIPVKEIGRVYAAAQEQRGVAG